MLQLRLRITCGSLDKRKLHLAIAFSFYLRISENPIKEQDPNSIIMTFEGTFDAFSKLALGDELTLYPSIHKRELIYNFSIHQYALDLMKTSS